MIGRRRSPMAGGVSPPAGPSVWRLLTLADLGTRLGSTAWDLSDSGDTARPIRLTGSTGSTVPAVWPVLLSGLIPVSEWRIYATWAGALNAGASAICAGSFDGSNASSVVAGGVSREDLAITSERRYRAASIVGTAITSTSGFAAYADDQEMAAYVQAYAAADSSISSGSRRRVAQSVATEGDGSIAASPALFSQGTTSGAGLGDADVPCIAVCSSASLARTIDVAIYVLATPAPVRG